MPGFFVGLILLSLVPVIKWNVKSHPNQYIYFNEIRGGIENAFGSYDLDYYGNSLREAALWVNEHAPPQESADKILVINYLNPDKFEFIGPEKKRWDIFIWLRRWQGRPLGNLIYTVETEGVPLVRVVR